MITAKFYYFVFFSKYFFSQTEKRSIRLCCVTVVVLQKTKNNNKRFHSFSLSTHNFSSLPCLLNCGKAVHQIKYYTPLPLRFFVFFNLQSFKTKCCFCLYACVHNYNSYVLSRLLAYFLKPSLTFSVFSTLSSFLQTFSTFCTRTRTLFYCIHA